MLEQSIKEMYEAALTKLEQQEHGADGRSAEHTRARKLFLEALLGGTNMLSWLTPGEDVVGEEVLAEHFRQIRNAVRFTLQHAFDDQCGAAVNLSAASTAARLIQTNIALAKALGVTGNSKTVRGVRPLKDPQD